MSRLGYLTRHPKRSLGALGTLAVAAGLTVGTGAYFQDTADSTANSVAAGKVELALYPSSSPTIDGNLCNGVTTSACTVSGVAAAPSDGATFAVSHLTPVTNSWDNAVVRYFEVQNTGDVPVRVRLTAQDLTGDSATLGKNVEVWLTRVPTAAPFNNYENVLADKAGTAGIGTTIGDLSNQIADTGSDNATRIPVAPGQRLRYELRMELPETSTDQSDLMSKSFGFTVRAIARSLSSAGA
jgi:predicted ribosomally synthesized peptide with SipW-like signal peptide